MRWLINRYIAWRHQRRIADLELLLDLLKAERFAIDLEI